MDKNKYYTREKVINGVKYVAQFNGLSCAMQSFDDSYVSDSSSNVSLLKMAKNVFKNAIVEPAGLDVDDFDSFDELNEVVRFGMEVMQGKFRDKNEKADKASSEG